MGQFFLPNSSSQMSEPLRYLPVAFVACNILGLYSVYVFHHCLPRLADPLQQSKVHKELLAIHISCALLVTCYLLCLMTDPGGIPDEQEDPTWSMVHCGGETPGEAGVQELKRTGDRRQCKWCAKLKPDRCHHCRVCRQCVLKMDHHCPWIHNCVGFKNHKYFFLLLVYSTISCHIIVWTMMDSTRAALDPAVPFQKMFSLLFGQTLASVLGALVTFFLLFHFFLMLKAMTTIEFCEKSMKRTGYNCSAYDRGLLGNVKATLGDNPLLWLLPVSLPSGRGLRFVNEATPLLTNAPVQHVGGTVKGQSSLEHA